ncbi:hypothetical protein ACHAQA_000222 [Verticillium albo-atrum]
MDSLHQLGLPSCDSPDLHITHLTPEECISIWNGTFPIWGDSLEELADYQKESRFMTTVPLAVNGGMTTWILVDKNLAPDKRPILCSCESFHKRALSGDVNGQVEEAVIHGIASVFCPEAYRNRGYATRHLKEIAQVLRSWQSDRVLGSVLYSDIGNVYYATLGWSSIATNTHLELQPTKHPESALVRKLVQSDLSDLCKRDEALVKTALAALSVDGSPRRKRVTVVPDLDHMLWHIAKEGFATNNLFGKIPEAKGAIAGSPGRQVWVIWTHRYYDRPDAPCSNNVLYILRVVVEGDKSANSTGVVDEDMVKGCLDDDQAESLEAVLHAAQNEAAEWHLDQVQLWEPSLWVRNTIAKSNIIHSTVDRTEKSIASIQWNEVAACDGLPPLWVNNEHFAWC